MRQLEIRLLGGFEVRVDSRPVTADAWPQRRAADLVKLLALAPGRRLPRDDVLERLWPQLGADAAASNLHKAASYARRALGAREAIVLRAGMVELAPAAEVTVDVDRFERGDDAAYGGELLPDDPYASWALAARGRVRELRLERARRRGDWEAVVGEEPADEEAQRALIRRDLAAGERGAAARRLQRLRDELTRAGLQPSAETLALAREVSRGPAVHATRLLRTPMEGREAELATASAALRRADSGTGGTVLVQGAMGAGKTRLLESVLAQADALGFHTLLGAAHEEEGRTPYAPVIEALDPLTGRRPELLAALGDGARAALARFAPVTATDAAVDRHRVFSAVGQLLAQAARERGVVLALDNLHAADAATAALVHYLARTAVRERLLLVLALRDEPLPAPVARLRSSLLERGAVDLALGPLGRAAVERVAVRAAGRPLAAPTLAAVVRAAAGNPFFAEELAASADAAGEITVPARLRAVAGHRLERLTPLGEALLAALAVMDDGFTAADLAALCPGQPAERALREAEAAGVVDAVRGRYRFRHALVQQELVARLPEALVRRAHADRAARLAAEDAPPEAVAHHLLRAGREREAVPLLTRAARWAEGVGAYGDGAEWVRLALEHADAPQRPALLELRARMLHGAGEPGAAHAFSAAIAAAPPARVPVLRAHQARACLAAGDLAGARLALDGVGDQDLPNRGEVILLRAMVAWHTGDWDTARRLSAEAHEHAPDPDELTTMKGMLAHLDGRWEQHSLRELTQVWDTPDLAGRVFDGYLCVTEYVLTSGDPYARLAAFAKRLRAQAHQAGARRGEAFAATVLGEIELLTGNLDAARAQLLDAARLSREAGAAGSESLARTRLGETLLQLGDRPGARAQLDQALELAHVSAVAEHLLFHVFGALLRAAEPDEAVALLERAETLFDPRWVCRFCPTVFHLAATGVCVRAGQLERAAAYLAQAEQGAAGWPGGPLPAAVAEARAELLLAQGDRRAGEQALRRAAEGYAAAGQVLNERRARAALTT